jgi:hypothetical protein
MAACHEINGRFFHGRARVLPVIDRFGKGALMSRCLLRIYPEVMSWDAGVLVRAGPGEPDG